MAEPEDGVRTVPGAILMTTNCIREPEDAYFDNMFTSAAVGCRKWPTSRDATSVR